VDIERSHHALAPTEHHLRDQLAEIGSTRAGLRLSEVEPLRVVAVRMLPGADTSWAGLREAGVGGLPGPGRCEGQAVRALWRSSTEVWLVTQQGDLLDGVLQALRPGMNPAACAIDHSAGTVGIELQAPDVSGFLAHLVDPSGIPAQPGQATRARCVDLAVVLMRLDEQRIWLLADRPVAGYLVEWLRVTADRTAV
jgi:sarcosine oxidase gamma subunit